MSNPDFAFDGYTVRPVAEQDRAFLEQQIANDQYHAGMDADYFLHLIPGEDAWAVENQQGKVVLYFKTKVVCRLAMLFGNQDSNENRDAMTKGVMWLEDMLAHNRFRELIFDTEGPALKAMAKRRLGFTEEPGVLVRYLPAPDIDKRLAALWNHVPQASQKQG
jgi:hypothetical protein